MKQLRLWWQLKRAGASKQERAELLRVARELNMGDVHLSREAKDGIAEQIGFKPMHVKARRRVGFAGAFALFLVLVVASVFAQPGSPLYALKRGIEDVRALVQPGYKQELEKERELEQERINHDSNDDRTGNDDRRGSDDTSTSGNADDSSGRSSGEDSTKNSDSSTRNSSGSGSDDTGGSSNSSGSSTGSSSGHGSDD